MNRELNPQWQRGNMLVAFLNKEQSAKPKPRKKPHWAEWAPTLHTVAELLEALQKLESLLSKKPRQVDNPVWWEWEVTREKLEESVNGVLWNCRFRPILSAHSGLDVRWLIANKPRVSREQMKAWHEAGGAMSNIPLDKTAVIQIMLEMATAGTLGRVRRCRCGLWFLAASSLKKVVCKDACRLKKYREKNKTKRRKYMRDYMRKPDVKNRRKLLAYRRAQKKAS